MGRHGNGHTRLALRDDDDLPPSELPTRPRTRGECINGLRPCPFVGCRYHLFLEVSKLGFLKSLTGAACPTELKETCALDVADRAREANEQPTLAELGDLLGLTRERVRQVEERALERVRVVGLKFFWGDLDDES